MDLTDTSRRRNQYGLMARLITRCISKKPVHCEQSMPLESVVVVVGWGDNPPTTEARIAQGINT